jgi:phosphoserine phosphatase
VLWCDFLMDEGLLDRTRFAPLNAGDGARLPRRHGQHAGLLRLLRRHAGRTQRRPNGSRWRERFWRERIQPRLYPGTPALLAQHRDRGDRWC